MQLSCSAHTHTRSYSRCRLTQRSTCGVTVKREGHWEMFLATCRASILKAASTSSSWAALKVRVGRKLMNFKDGEEELRPKDERAKKKYIYRKSWAQCVLQSKLKSGWKVRKWMCRMGIMLRQEHTLSHIRATNGLKELFCHPWSANTPVVFGRKQWGWSLPGQAPGIAGDPHSQTACLTGGWPEQEQEPPWRPGQRTIMAPGGGQGEGRDQQGKASSVCFKWQHLELSLLV